MFSNGTINCNGSANTINLGLGRLRRYARKLQRLGYTITLKDVKILTISGYHRVSGPLRLDELTKDMKGSYEPELFPSAYIKKEGITFSCFYSGKVIITGIKRIEDIDEVVNPSLIEIEMYTVYE